MTRADLIAALEKAEGPSRGLDAEIAFDLFAKPVGKSPVDGGPIGYIWPEDDPSWSLARRFPGKDRAWFTAVRKRIGGETLVIERDGALVLMNAQRVKHYTASLDAALPWEKIVTMVYYKGGYECQQINAFSSPGWHKLEAIARRIAALKAREAGDG